MDGAAPENIFGIISIDLQTMGSMKLSTKVFVPVLALILFTLATLNGISNAELTPPYFNLAEGRHIYASSTCGVGVDGPELYCKLVGGNTEHETKQTNHSYKLIQGQV